MRIYKHIIGSERVKKTQRSCFVSECLCLVRGCGQLLSIFSDYPLSLQLRHACPLRLSGVLADVQVSRLLLPLVIALK